MPAKKVRIYTRGGDKGKTSLYGGKRVSKASARIDAIGNIDELNASLGACITEAKSKKTGQILTSTQNTLFNIGAELANPEMKGKDTKRIFQLEQREISGLEKIIDQIDSRLNSLSNFILPGGTESASRLHLARSIARRAERRILELSRKEKVNPVIFSYINRLSDLLFVLARYENKEAGVKDQPWKRR